MAVCDRWVALKIVEFLGCVACLVAKRVSDDDSQRLALLLQKYSREWSLLNTVTWDSIGSSFGDAVYGGYTIITFGLLLGKIFQEVPKGRRILEGFLLGLGMALFLVLGGLELSALDAVPHNLVVNAAVLGALSLFVALLFLLDLLGPRVFTEVHSSQTDPPNAVVVRSAPEAPRTQQPAILGNGQIPNGVHTQIEDHTIERHTTKTNDPKLYHKSQNGFTKYDDETRWDKEDLEKSKFGSYRNGFDNGNYVRLADPIAESDRLHYEKELARFNEKFFRDYLDSDAIRVREAYLPELQTPAFTKVKNVRNGTLYDDLSPSYKAKTDKNKKNGAQSPTLKQLEDYLKSGKRSKSPMSALFPMEPIEEKRDSIDAARGTPVDPGYVQYTADHWNDEKIVRTPRHSPQ